MTPELLYAIRRGWYSRFALAAATEALAHAHRVEWQPGDLEWTPCEQPPGCYVWVDGDPLGFVPLSRLLWPMPWQS
jgi:hypothetical protein